jgi:hypothetical protein
MKIELDVFGGTPYAMLVAVGFYNLPYKMSKKEHFEGILECLKI